MRSLTRAARRWRLALPALLLLAACVPACAASVLRVAYAGSMGTVMDRALGPAFAHANDVTYQGIGQGSYALARLLAARRMRADVFVCVTAGPVQVLERAGLAGESVSVASTRMVVVYSRKSRFAKDFEEAAAGRKAWFDVLRMPGLRFGRTDPAVDPQGANALFVLQLAERYYHLPHLLREIAGPARNHSQVFAETSLLSRLEAGQIDATIGYLSAARSRGLPTVRLPDAIDLSDPSMQARWYATAQRTLANGKRVQAQPLVFHAVLLTDAAQPALGRRFVDFLRGAAGQSILRRYGYGPPAGNGM